MSLLVTGSIGIDTVESPLGRADNVLGGSSVYFAFAASHFVPVRLVGVVGEDFPQAHMDLLATRRIDLEGLERRVGSRTFRWSGKYLDDINERETLGVELNVLAEDGPPIPPSYADSRFVFLANTHPDLQRLMLSKVESPQTVVCDTMNLWIENERESLMSTLKLVNGVIINDGEARQLTGCRDLLDAGDRMLALGPRFVIIKKGEHGALLMSGGGPVAIPAYPSRHVKDPTGAGDSFAGGFMGYLCQQGDDSPEVLRRAMVRGTVMASFAIEDFSLNRLAKLAPEEVDERTRQFCAMLRIE